MHRLRTASVLTWSLVPVTFALVVFGSTVRANGAGLACPDWPLCFGEVIPALDFGVFLEFGHRVLASFVSLWFVAIGVALWRAAAPFRLKAIWLLGLALLGVQVVLGGLTVLELLAEWTVTSHLLGGNAFSLTLLLLALSIRDHTATVERGTVSWAARVAGLSLAGLVLAQMTLGGLVSSSGAGLACGTWPGCNGSVWFPSFQGIIGLQVMHRITAYLVFSGALMGLIATQGRGRLGRVALLVFGLVTMQVCLGVANVLMLIPVEVTVAHAAGGAAIVLATTWFNYEAWMAPAAVAAPASDDSRRAATGGAA